MRTRNHLTLVNLGTLAILTTLATEASAQGTGAPPPDAKAAVGAVAAPKEALKLENKDVSQASIAGGLQLTTGNSRLLALSANGNFEIRRDRNGFLGALVANYGEGSASASAPRTTTAENVQGKLRYERYFIDPLAGFLQLTGRYDRFQGLLFRLNVDPGVKAIFFQNDTHSMWGELGYDLQHDTRLESARGFVDADGNQFPFPQPNFLPKTYTDHSVRAYVGYRAAVNKIVTFSTGIEFIQSFKEFDRSRLNFDALVAAKLFAGFSLGVGFSARFDNAPLANKEKLDTVTTATIIYAWEPKPEPPPPPPPAPPCVPQPTDGAPPATPPATPPAK